MDRDLIVSQWHERVLRTYPEAHARLLRIEGDPFRNPVGHTLREGLSVLVEEILGGMSSARVTAALDGIIRIRAVQALTAGQAVSFVLLLRDVVREHLQGQGEFLAAVERRIDELAMQAFDLYTACREKMYEIRANERKRSTYVQSRLERRSVVH